MAEAIIKGICSCKLIPSKNIRISDKDPKRSEKLSIDHGVTVASSNTCAVKGANVIILAVKPQVMALVLEDLGKKIGKEQLVISIAAGITLNSLEKYLSQVPVIRVMPNNPCLIGKGVSCISKGKNVNNEHVETAKKIFSSVGDVFEVEEKLMNAVTGLSGSGPAFVYEAISAMTAGGVEAGLSKEMSQKLSELTVLGSVLTVINTGASPEELKNMVTSPGGTTLAGLRVMDEGKFKQTLSSAVVKAAARAEEISKEFDKSL